MDVLHSRRIVLLGKTGVGKSSLANTILGEQLFTIDHSAISGTSKCQTKTKSVNGRGITLIDTPGLFDTGRSEDDMRPEIVRCITECAPGPHAFLVVFKVEKFTEQEQAVITKICQYFSEDALKYSVIVFTHGDQLQEGTKIKDFVIQNKDLRDLVKKCGGRCHVVDNKYWKINEGDDYRSNQFQVAEILSTLDKMTEANKGGCYTNQMLQEVNREIQREEERFRQSPGNMSQEEIRKQAKQSAFGTLLIKSAGIATGALLGALLGLAEMVARAVPGVATTESGRGTVALAAKSGLVKGALTGYAVAEGAESSLEAILKAAEAVWKQSSVSGSQSNN